MGYKTDPTYVACEGRRKTAYSRRVRSFLKKAMELNSMTGADMLVISMYEDKSMIEFSSRAAEAIWNKYQTHLNHGGTVERYTPQDYPLLRDADSAPADATPAPPLKRTRREAAPRPAPHAAGQRPHLTAQPAHLTSAVPGQPVPMEFLPVCALPDGYALPRILRDVPPQWALEEAGSDEDEERRGIFRAASSGMIPAGLIVQTRLREEMASFVASMAHTQIQTQRPELPAMPTMPAAPKNEVVVETVNSVGYAQSQVHPNFPSTGPAAMPQVQVFGEFGAFGRAYPYQPHQMQHPHYSIQYHPGQTPQVMAPHLMAYPQQHYVPQQHSIPAAPPTAPPTFQAQPQLTSDAGTSFVDLDGPVTEWGDTMFDLDSLNGEFLDHEEL